MAATAVDLDGLVETRSLFRQFEPDLLRRLNRRMTSVSKDLQSGAQENFERTGASGTAYRVISRTRASGISRSVTTVPGSVSAGEHWSDAPGLLAAIFELMAAPRSAKPQNMPRVKSLVATLNSRYGAPGRFLWQQWDDKGDDYVTEITAEVEALEAAYTERLRQTA